ncbi:MAG: hypothetical protein ABSH28_18540, partial [Acidobacteriota bacterium]
KWRMDPPESVRILGTGRWASLWAAHTCTPYATEVNRISISDDSRPMTRNLLKGYSTSKLWDSFEVE